MLGVTYSLNSKSKWMKVTVVFSYFLTYVSFIDDGNDVDGFIMQKNYVLWAGAGAGSCSNLLSSLYSRGCGRSREPVLQAAITRVSDYNVYESCDPTEAVNL